MSEGTLPADMQDKLVVIIFERARRERMVGQITSLIELENDLVILAFDGFPLNEEDATFLRELTRVHHFAAGDTIFTGIFQGAIEQFVPAAFAEDYGEDLAIVLFYDVAEAVIHRFYDKKQ